MGRGIRSKGFGSYRFYEFLLMLGMRKSIPLVRLVILPLLFGAVFVIGAAGHAFVGQGAPTSGPSTQSSEPVYSRLERPTRDGTGKVYMGREIAQVMGHLAAGWLERPGREAEEKPALLMENLDLEPDHVVADIGAGSGYFTFRLAERVPEGKVLAVDIQRQMLRMINRGERERGLTNVEPILGRIDDPKLPVGEVDLVLMVDAYHEFSHPREMMTAIVESLAEDGRVALVEYRGEDPEVNIKPLHKMTQAQVKKEMAAVGLEHMKTIDVLPTQHLMIFRRAAEANHPAG